MKFDYKCSKLVANLELSFLYRLFKILLVLGMIILLKKYVIDGQLGGGGIMSFSIALIIAYVISGFVWNLTYYISYIPSPNRDMVYFEGDFVFFDFEEKYSINICDIDSIGFNYRHPINLFMKNKIHIKTNSDDVVIKTNFSYMPLYKYLDSFQES